MNGGRASDRPPTGHCVPLVATGVRKRYGTAVALAGVDLDVRAGTIVGIVGPNGSGKTTLLNAVAGLVALDAGTIEVAGSPAGSRLARSRCGARSRRSRRPRRAHRGGAHRARPRALASRGRSGRPRRGAAVRVRARAPPPATARDALARPARQASRRRRLLARSAAPPGRRGDCDARPRGRCRPRRGARDARGRGCGVLLATQDLHFAGAVCDELLLLDRGVVADRGGPRALRARHAAATLEDAFLSAVGDAGLRERVRGELAAL